VADRRSLRIERLEHDGCHRLVLAGELDLVSVAQMELELMQVCAGGALEIELDLRELSFIDSVGLRALVAARETCEEQLVELFLVSTQGARQEQLLQASGLLELPWRAATPSETVGRPAPSGRVRSIRPDHVGEYR
jgi:anti-anti-sigma factor